MEGGTIYTYIQYMQSMVYQTVKLFILQYSVLSNDATLSQQMLQIKYKTLRNDGKFNIWNWASQNDGIKWTKHTGCQLPLADATL